MEYSYKLIFDKQEFILDGKLRENLESEYGLIRQIDDILDGDTGIIYSFDKKVELIRWYESQGGIKETANHWFAELNQNLSSENIFVMHQTKHSHLLKLLKDIIKNQIFLGKLIIDKSEILLRKNIFN